MCFILYEGCTSDAAGWGKFERNHLAYVGLLVHYILSQVSQLEWSESKACIQKSEAEGSYVQQVTSLHDYLYCQYYVMSVSNL
jgi:hypothetical protein